MIDLESFALAIEEQSTLVLGGSVRLYSNAPAWAPKRPRASCGCFTDVGGCWHGCRCSTCHSQRART